MVSEPLALTTGGDRPRRVAPMASLLLAASGTMLFGGLIAAYLRLRTVIGEWPPKGLRYDEYLGNLLMLTMVLSAATMEWACQSQRREVRRHANTALAITIGLGVAFLNLLWYTAARAEFDASSHPYGVVVTALAMVLGIAVAVGIGMLVLTLSRVLGRQRAGVYEQMRASAHYWYFTVAATLAVWYVVVVLK